MQPSQKSSLPNAKQEMSNSVEFKYDNSGRVVKKVSPDTGCIEFLYDDTNQKAYEKIYDLNRRSTTVLYYKYDAKGNLMQTGQLLGSGLKHKSQHDLDVLHKRKLFQKFYYNDEDNVSMERTRRKTIKTVFDWRIEEGLPLKQKQSTEYQGNVIEKYTFSRKGYILSKKLLIADNDSSMAHSYTFSKRILGNSGNARTLTYPMLTGKFFNLYHSYDKLGNLVGLGSKINPFEYFKFDYNSQGNLVREQHLLVGDSNLTRIYSYNSPGYLINITDDFFEESLEYTRNGYGQDGFGDGIVMEAKIIPKWQDKCNPNWLILNDQEKQSITEICVKALQNIGVLSDYSKVSRRISKRDELLLPSTCKGSVQYLIENLICSKSTPQQYSYRFRYGDHQELISAKYLPEDEEITSPLSLRDLKETAGSEAILVWESLIKEKFIVTDNRYFDTSKARAQVVGKFSSLTDLPDATRFKNRLHSFVEDSYFGNKSLSLDNLKTMFYIWSGCRENNCSPHVKSTLDVEATDVYNIFESNSLISNSSISSNVLDSRLRILDFTALQNKFDTLKMLFNHRENGILSHPYDFEAFDSDANGNHKIFYNGFKRFTLEYETGTNKIKQVSISDATKSGIPELSFAIDHDERGNVVKAMHKNIERIHYHPVSQRTTQIDLLDGRYLRFVYDAAGERVLKLVYNAQNLLLSRTYYVRDEKSRVLTDVKTVYAYNPAFTSKTETLYIYGPRGLVGFIRNDEFYSVITDHVGSVRLVVKDRTVVAAFDYFPYGELQRAQRSDCSMDYLYSGKEYDEETGLYNFHARLYDPSIGRFYQADPQAQYFNPYLFAGNSPVSLVDPDGEFAVTLALVIGCAIAGAYLSGASVSNEWDPTKWNWKSGELWGALVGGAIAGAMVPFTGPTAFAGLGIKGAFALVVFSSGVAYISTAAANNNWNPAEWDWSSPVTINGLITGFISGLSLASGIRVLHTRGAPYIAAMFTNKKLAARAFIGISYTFGAAVAYGKVASAQNEAAFWKWEFSSPAIYSGLIDGFDSGLGWPQNVMESFKGMTKLSKNILKFAGSYKNIKRMLKDTKGLLKLGSSPLFKTVSSIAMGALMVSSANGFYQDGWNNDFATYESLINGMFFGKDMRNLATTFKMLKMKSKLKKLNLEYDRYFKSKNYQLSDADIKKALANYMLDTTEIQNGLAKKKLQETMDNFLSGKIRKSEVIAILKDNGVGNVFTNKFSLLDADIDATNTRRKEFFPEQELPFMQCGGKRRRRSTGKNQASFIEGFSEFPPLTSTSSLLRRENVNSFRSQGPRRLVKDVWCRNADTGDSFWCFQDQLHIFVSPMRGDCSLGSQKPAPQLLGDSYSNCHTVNDGVYCQGQRTSILVTQIPRVNALDVLTAQAMLLRVAVHAAATMWKSLSSLFTTAPSQERFTLTDTTLCRWKESLRSLEQMQTDAGQNWARVEIDDCKQIIDKIGMSAAQDEVDVLEERLEALAIDLAECLDDYTTHSTQHNYSTTLKHDIGYKTVNITRVQNMLENTSKHILN
jgi:RHS repeat-associated protein